MATSQLEKEQRDSLMRRIRDANEKHRRDGYEKVKRPPPEIRAAIKLVRSWERQQARKRYAAKDRIARRAKKLENELLFTEPRKMLAKVERFEKTGK